MVTIGSRTKKSADEDYNDENDMEQGFQRQSKQRRIYRETSVSQHFVSYDLYGELKEVEYYLDLIHTLHSMEKDDSITLFIDGCGGYIDTMKQLINAIEFCKGSVNGVLTGDAASAHSFLVLAMPNLQVSQRASMMIHSASFGTSGKEHEVTAYVKSTDDFIKNLKKEFYSGFLSEQELRDLDIGKDFYFTYIDIVKRLKSRNTFLLKHQKITNTKSK